MRPLYVLYTEILLEFQRDFDGVGTKGICSKILRSHNLSTNEKNVLLDDFHKEKPSKTINNKFFKHPTFSLFCDSFWWMARCDFGGEYDYWETYYIRVSFLKHLISKKTPWYIKLNNYLKSYEYY